MPEQAKKTNKWCRAHMTVCMCTNYEIDSQQYMHKNIY